MLDESLEAQVRELGVVSPLLEAFISKLMDHLPIESNVPSAYNEVNLCCG